MPTPSRTGARRPCERDGGHERDGGQVLNRGFPRLRANSGSSGRANRSVLNGCFAHRVGLAGTRAGASTAFERSSRVGIRSDCPYRREIAAFKRSGACKHPFAARRQMLQNATIEAQAAPATPTAGPLYPTRRFECPKMAAETDGAPPALSRAGPCTACRSAGCGASTSRAGTR